MTNKGNRRSGFLSRKGEEFPAAGHLVAGSRELFALVSAVVVVGLVLLSTTKLHRLADAGTDGPLQGSSQYRQDKSSDAPENPEPESEPLPVSPLVERKAGPVAAESRLAASEPAATDSGGAEFDWISALYPELAHIVELEEQDPDSALQELLPLLASDDPVVRLAALESVADMNHAAKLPSLLAALDDPDAQIRVAALEGLMLHGDPAAAASIETMVYDQDPEVRAAAVDALAGLANPASVHVLAGLLYDPDRQIRIDAVGALGEIGGADALGYLRQMRYDADESVRASANAILDEEAIAAAF